MEVVTDCCESVHDCDTFEYVISLRYEIIKFITCFPLRAFPGPSLIAHFMKKLIIITVSLRSIPHELAKFPSAASHVLDFISIFALKSPHMIVKGGLFSLIAS